MQDNISVLVSARRDSKYLAKFLLGYFDRTDNLDNTEILVILNAHDTWNTELVRHFQAKGVKFITENYQLGRNGLHQYLNDLVKLATGDWLIYFCEDHFITADHWDTYIRRLVNAKLTVHTEVGEVPKIPERLDPNGVWCLVPRFDNCGAVNHVLSRGYVAALGGILGRHGWIDSYINDINDMAFGRISPHVIRMDDALFHDFTHDHPNPMEAGAAQSVLSDKGRTLPLYASDINKSRIAEDAARLKRASE